MLHKFYAWTHLSNFNQSEHRNLTWSVTNTWPWLEKVLPACILKKLAEFWRLRSVWNQNRNSAGRYWHKHSIFDMNWKKISKREPAIIWKRINCHRITSKKYSTLMGRHLSPQYGQVILVSGYPVLTPVNWWQHWCAISFLLGFQSS